jgi:hypothetical protein
MAVFWLIEQKICHGLKKKKLNNNRLLEIKMRFGAGWTGVTFFYRMLKILVGAKDEDLIRAEVITAGYLLSNGFGPKPTASKPLDFF